MKLFNEKGNIVVLELKEIELLDGVSYYNMTIFRDKEEIGYCNFRICPISQFNPDELKAFIYKIEITDEEKRGQSYGKALLDSTEFFLVTQQKNIKQIEGDFNPDKNCYEQAKNFYLRNGYRLINNDDNSCSIKKILDDKTKQTITEKVYSKLLAYPVVEKIKSNTQKSANEIDKYPQKIEFISKKDDKKTDALGE